MTGDEIRKLRLGLGLSQEDFAHDVLGVTGVTVSRWEREVALIDDLKAKVEAYTSSIARIPTLTDVMTLLAVAFFSGALHVV